VLMLSVAGVYALMSFTVSRRTREIAIRNAVGARRSEIVGAVFRRAGTQLAVGVALGSLVAVPVIRDRLAEGSVRSLLIVVAVLLAAGIAACFVPVRRALAIEPAAAMRAD
jgi:putative ABC transport system permease protein